MKAFNFLCLKKVLAKLKKNCINVFCYENKLTYPVYLLDQEFENCMGFLMISEEDKSN